MDRPVALGPQGFPVTSGTTYRLASWIAAAAFRVLPWNAPGTNDIVGAIRRVWPDAVVFMPWDDLPNDWPKAGAGIPTDAFLENAEGVWRGAGVAPAAMAMKGFDEPIHVAAVFEREPGAAPSPPPPGSSPAPPTPPSQPATPPARPPSTPPAPPSPRRRALRGGAALALGGAAVLGVALVLARSRGFSAARRRIPA